MEGSRELGLREWFLALGPLALAGELKKLLDRLPGVIGAQQMMLKCSLSGK